MKTTIKFPLSQPKSPIAQPHKSFKSIEKLFAQKASKTKHSLKNNFDLNINLSIRTKNNKIISFDKNLVPNLLQCFSRRKDLSPNQIIPNGQYNYNNYIYTSNNNNNLNFEICNMLPIKKQTKKKSAKKLIPVKSSKINLIDHNSLTLREFVTTINTNNKTNKLFKNNIIKNEKPTKLVKKCLGTPLTYRDDNLFLKQALTNSKLISINNQFKNELLDESKDDDNNIINDIDLNSSSNCNSNNCKSVIKNYSTSSYKYGFIDSSINTDNSYLNSMAKNKKIFCFNKDMEMMNNISNTNGGSLYKINNKYLPPITSNSIFSTGVHKNIHNTFMINNELIKDKMYI